MGREVQLGAGRFVQERRVENIYRLGDTVVEEHTKFNRKISNLTPDDPGLEMVLRAVEGKVFGAAVKCIDTYVRETEERRYW